MKIIRETPKGEKRRRFRFWFLLPAAVGVLLFLILPYWPWGAEWIFARGVFRFLSVPLGALTSLLPFSLTEAAVITAAAAGIAALLVGGIRWLRRRGEPRRERCRQRRWPLRTAWAASLLFLFYLLLHGLNFYRLPVGELMDLPQAPRSAEYLQRVCADLARRASEERAALYEDADGCFQLSQPLSSVLNRSGEGYAALQEEYPFLWGPVNRGKPVQLSHWWSYTGITGMYFPFFAEANVNIDVPDSGIPATAAHELAHTRGFAREDECNFLAYLACIHHSSGDVRYSGYLSAYILCSNALYEADREGWNTAAAQCSEGMLRDLRQRSRYWKAFEGGVQEASTVVNDGFLQAQGQTEGVLTYDRAVELILAWYADQSLV